MSQLIDASNMPMPTFDRELAIKMTVNARFAKTPQRDGAPADASDLTLELLDKRDPALHVRAGDAQEADQPRPLRWRANLPFQGERPRPICVVTAGRGAPGPS